MRPSASARSAAVAAAVLCVGVLGGCADGVPSSSGAPAVGPGASSTQPSATLEGARVGATAAAGTPLRAAELQFASTVAGAYDGSGTPEFYEGRMRVSAAARIVPGIDGQPGQERDPMVTLFLERGHVTYTNAHRPMGFQPPSADCMFEVRTGSDLATSIRGLSADPPTAVFRSGVLHRFTP